MKNPSKKLFNQLVILWPEVELLQQKFYKELNIIEKKIRKQTGIDDLEIFCDEDIPVGIGDVNREMRLIHGDELRRGEMDKE
jgi:hypothetical protein